MKKVLILAYDFPPYISVGGLRPYSWYKYFKEFGLYPVVVTRQWTTEHGNHLDYVSPGYSKKAIVEKNDFGTIIRTPYFPNFSNKILLKYGEKKFKAIRKLISAFYEIFQFLFFSGPKVGLYKGAKEYLRSNQIDFIIATGSPHILFKYASKLSKDFQIPWVADYRDPWSQSQSRNRYGLLTFWNRYFEKKFTKNAAAITTVSEFLKSQISLLINEKEIFLIFNGFDPDAIAEAANISPRNDCLGIGFAGTIYSWHPLTHFFEGVSNAMKKKKFKKLKVTFWGINKGKEIHSLISKKFPELIGIVETYPKLENNILLKKLAEQHILLLFNDYPLIGTKIFDYIALKRPILFCFNEKPKETNVKLPYNGIKLSNKNEWPQAELIKKTKSGQIVENQSNLVRVLIHYINEYTLKKEISFSVIGYEKFSRKKQAENFAEIINSL